MSRDLPHKPGLSPVYQPSNFAWLFQAMAWHGRNLKEDGLQIQVQPPLADQWFHHLVLSVEEVAPDSA
jgi:hypothetical protein